MCFTLDLLDSIFFLDITHCTFNICFKVKCWNIVTAAFKRIYTSFKKTKQDDKTILKCLINSKVCIKKLHKEDTNTVFFSPTG